MAGQPRKIVVGYDGSNAAKRALDTAADLAGYGSTVTVVTAMAKGGMEAAVALAEAHERLLRRHVPATYLEAGGEPALELLDAAQALNADVIVIGRRNGGQRTRNGLGSVARAVVSGAPCDVLLVSDADAPTLR